MIVSLREGASALLRPPTPDDLPYVIDTWVRSQRKAPAWRDVETGPFRRGFTAIVQAVLQSQSTRAIVACDEGAASTIYGFAVWTDEPIAIHMVYVKGFMRGLGLGLALAKTACAHFGEVPIPVTATSAPMPASESPTRRAIRFEDLAAARRLSYDPFRILGARA